MQVKIKGVARSRASWNLFGWRVQLWRKTTNVDETIDLPLIGVHKYESKVRVPGPLDAWIKVNLDIDDGVSTAGIVLAFDENPELAIYDQEWDLALVPTDGITRAVNISWRGNSFKGTLTLAPHATDQF